MIYQIYLSLKSTDHENVIIIEYKFLLPEAPKKAIEECQMPIIQ